MTLSTDFAEANRRKIGRGPVGTLGTGEKDSESLVHKTCESTGL
jgi:hypothetical protein